MERRKDGRTEGRKAENYVPPLFFEKAGDNKGCSKTEIADGCSRAVVFVWFLL